MVTKVYNYTNTTVDPEEIKAYEKCAEQKYGGDLDMQRIRFISEGVIGLN